MPLPATLLIIATVVPLISFTVLVFMGKRMGKPFAGYVATAAIALSFFCSIGALAVWVPGAGEEAIEKWGMGRQPINVPFPWVPVGPGIGQDHAGFLDVGVYVDSLTIVMFCMVTLVAMLVHIFSIGYMADDKRFPRFFTYLSLFCFSMLGLVIGGTILQLFIFWELVGLCSYLLIGFWYEKKSASNAAIKAFVVNRVGDFGFLIGLGILFYYLGNVTFPQVWATLDATRMTPQGINVGSASGAPIWFTPTLLTVMGIGLFFGAVGKSAQFPLHVWLPDAMEGPTPVSALIHAATMVAAGVYLVGRIFPILTPDARLFIAIIGVTTLTMAALIAVAQSDIKKVLAYSTLSQLGYMILAMGIGSWVGGLFHLITHAFFKALLFLGSGSVIHAAHHEQELPQYGGLWRKIPVTAATFGIAVLAIAGIPYLSGWWSKDMILEHAAAFGYVATHDGHGSKYYWLLFILPVAIAYVTPFYMTRCWMLTFWGKPRNQHLYDHAHESPILVGPLLVLAILSLVGGVIGVRQMIDASIVESTALTRQTVSADFNGFDQAWPSARPPEAEVSKGGAIAAHIEGYHLMHNSVMAAPFVGIGLGVLMYLNGYSVAKRITAIPPMRMMHTWLYRRMYFDELYNGTVVVITMGLASLGAAIDRFIIDGLVNGTANFVRRLSVAAGLHDKYVVDGAVNGMANLTQGLGAAVRAPQSGRIRMYVTALVAVIAVGIAIAVVVAWRMVNAG
jgi:proton-translocating NADH-quinone oxidoreductase chain L